MDITLRELGFIVATALAALVFVLLVAALVYGTLAYALVYGLSLLGLIEFSHAAVLGATLIIFVTVVLFDAFN